MIRKIIFLLSFVLLSCENVLDETAKRNTPEAVYYQAKMRLNERDYTGAINLLQSLGPAFLAQRPVSLVYASAYSGRCGLEFVTFADSLQGVASAGSIFSFLMGTYPDSTDTRIADCVVSEGIVNSFGTASQRSADENVLMGLSSLTKVGVILNRYADTDSDGSPDAGFDHCDNTDFPEDGVREIGSGIAQSILSIAAVGSGLSDDALQEITDLCAIDPQLNVFCTTTDKNAFNATEVSALRSVLGSSDLGIGSCVGGFLACICP